MALTFDLEKSRRNQIERGLPFSLAEDFEWGTAWIAEDIRRDYGERRFQALGQIRGQLHMLVFTPRRSDLHVISLRRANSRERRRYALQTES